MEQAEPRTLDDGYHPHGGGGAHSRQGVIPRVQHLCAPEPTQSGSVPPVEPGAVLDARLQKEARVRLVPLAQPFRPRMSNPPSSQPQATTSWYTPGCNPRAEGLSGSHLVGYHSGHGLALVETHCIHFVHMLAFINEVSTIDRIHRT